LLLQVSVCGGKDSRAVRAGDEIIGGGCIFGPGGWKSKVASRSGGKGEKLPTRRHPHAHRFATTFVRANFAPGNDTQSPIVNL
jgi:hypothetical protein